MTTVYEPRASTIIYNLLTSRTDQRPFLLPANICPIVPITFLKAGKSFEFVDIAPDTLQMDLQASERLLKTGRCGGLLYAHTYGEPSTPESFFEHIREMDNSLLLIDDRCLCPPKLTPDPQQAAHVSLYSTGYAKVVEMNLGGYAFLADEVPYQHARLAFNPQALENIEQGYKQAIATRQEYVYHGQPWLETERALPDWRSYRDTVTDLLPSARRQRQELNQIYSARLPAEIQLPAAYQEWRYNIVVPDKQRILDAIFAAGLFASSHYASLAGIFTPGRCHQAEKLAGQVINFFNDRHFTKEMAERTCDIILKNL